jgi:hypothetical protein
LLSSQGAAAQVMKNWQPLVLGPELAMERRKGLLGCVVRIGAAEGYHARGERRTWTRTWTWTHRVCLMAKDSSAKAALL